MYEPYTFVILIACLVLMNITAGMIGGLAGFSISTWATPRSNLGSAFFGALVSGLLVLIIGFAGNSPVSQLIVGSPSIFLGAMLALTLGYSWRKTNAD